MVSIFLQRKWIHVYFHKCVMPFPGSKHCARHYRHTDEKESPWPQGSQGARQIHANLSLCKQVKTILQVTMQVVLSTKWKGNRGDRDWFHLEESCQLTTALLLERRIGFNGKKRTRAHRGKGNIKSPKECLEWQKKANSSAKLGLHQVCADGTVQAWGRKGEGVLGLLFF